jgi:phosphatidylglycerol:prolipoprotein diacylglycerol transferase
MTIFELDIFWIHLAPSYYWLMYAIWFLSWYYIILKRWFLNAEKLDNLFIYIFAWVVLWWRIWYVIFYNLEYFLANPSHILSFWEWWMSFHGWTIWVIIAMIIFSKRNKTNFYKLADQITAVLPIWLGLGRIWNYLNKELLGYSPYNWPLNIDWKFPSPLVEMLLEWIILFIILNFVYKKRKFDWQVASLFLIFYWIFRIFVEAFFRMPDKHIWYIWKYFTLWEIYSLPMIIFGLYFYFKLKNQKNNLN